MKALPKLLGVAATAALTATLVACGSSASTSTSSDASSQASASASSEAASVDYTTGTPWLDTNLEGNVTESAEANQKTTSSLPSTRTSSWSLRFPTASPTPARRRTSP